MFPEVGPCTYHGDTLCGLAGFLCTFLGNAHILYSPAGLLIYIFALTGAVFLYSPSLALCTSLERYCSPAQLI